MCSYSITRSSLSVSFKDTEPERYLVNSSDVTGDLKPWNQTMSDILLQTMSEISCMGHEHHIPFCNMCMYIWFLVRLSTTSR